MGNVGGQAVIEGVMMRGNKYIATSVRKNDGLITTRLEEIEKKHSNLSKIPVLRGIINLFTSIKTGIEVMNYSASFFESEEEKLKEEKSKINIFLNKISLNNADTIRQIITILISFLLAIVFFTLIPTVIASVFRRFGISRVLLNIIEAVIKLAMFFLYLVVVSKVPEIDRVFRYHGAEHKSIAAYENNLELNVENVRKSSRYHARCGTNFMFLVLIVSIIVFTFIPTFNIKWRVLLKLLLIPVVSGITYEIIMWLGKNNSVISNIISYPGKLLQKLTTKEPDDKMIEVAIEALKYSEGMNYTIKEAREYGNKILKHIPNYRLDVDVLLSYATGLSKSKILMDPNAEISKENYEKFCSYINERLKLKPVSYITNVKEFMGLDFVVNENVLIPRPDTEVLVEKAEEIINKKFNDKEKIRVLDMCTGSGAIGISIASRNKNTEVLLCDVSQDAINIARENIVKNEVVSNCEAIQSDLFNEVKVKENFDLIVSNPPYIKREEIKSLMKSVRDYEPTLALDGGEDGLIFYEAISDKARVFLNKDSYLLFEIGLEQGMDVKNIMEKYGFIEIEIIKDLEGRDRVVIGKFIHDL